MPDPNNTPQEKLTSPPLDFEPIEARLDQLDVLQEALAGESIAAAQTAAGLPVPSEIEALSWSLLDGMIDSGEMEKLESLLRSDETAVKTYVDCALLHADLHEFFAAPNPTQ